MDATMKSAKLFALAAAGFAAIGVWDSLNPNSPLVFIRNVVFPSMYLALSFAVIFAIFGFLDYARARLVREPMSGRLGLAELILTILPAGGVVWALRSIRADPGIAPELEVQKMKVKVIFFAVGMVCFFVGCILFAISFGWTLILAFRTRGRPHLEGNA